MRMMHFYLLL